MNAYAPRRPVLPLRPEDRAYREALLDEALEDSFPASDPAPWAREDGIDAGETACDSVPPMNQQPWPPRKSSI